MTRTFAIAGIAAVLLLALGSPAIAQGDDTRPAGATFLGDTGLWFVPTAEVLANRTFSASGQRTNIDREQGFTDIQHYVGTFAVGLGNHTEIFGSFRFLTRVDRDIRPLFNADRARVGGIVNEYPLVNDQFSGNQVGDCLIGTKV